MMSIHRIALQLSVAALMAVGISACSEKGAAKPSGAVRPVMTLMATASTSLPSAEYAGTVRSRFETRLAFRTSGQITARIVEVGDSLAQGQVLMRMDPGDAALAASSASAQADSAAVTADGQSRDLTRAQGLLKEGFISESEFEHQKSSTAQAVAQMKSARAQRDSASRQVGYTTLIAPRSGVLSDLTAEVGTNISAGQPVATLADPQHLEIAISVPEDQVDQLKAAQQIWVTLWADQTLRYAGHLRTLSQVANAQTRTFDARITLDAPAGQVRLGQTASVQVARATGPSVIRVPLTAIDQRSGKAQLWIFDPARSQAIARTVTLAGVDKNDALISAGLNPGERVIMSGVHILRQGQPVRLMQGERGAQS